MKGRPHEEVFLPAIAPSYIFATLPNRFYRTDEEYEQALADALHQEYRAIVDAGFVLQVDDPRLVTYYMMNPGLSVADCRAWAARRVEAINHALRGIPPARVRFHTCYSIDVGPRVHDMALKDIVDVLFQIKAGALSFEAANPRHEHEYHVFEQFKPPAGMVLIPGRHQPHYQSGGAPRVDRRAHRPLRPNRGTRQRDRGCRLRLRRLGHPVQRHPSERGLAEVRGLGRRCAAGHAPAVGACVSRRKGREDGDGSPSSRSRTGAVPL